MNKTEKDWGKKKLHWKTSQMNYTESKGSTERSMTKLDSHYFSKKTSIKSKWKPFKYSFFEEEQFIKGKQSMH
jgi:hypothetical protein